MNPATTITIAPTTFPAAATASAATQNAIAAPNGTIASSAVSNPNSVGCGTPNTQ